MTSYFSGAPVAPNNVSFGDALRRSGLNPVETTMALPYMFLAPAGSDPDMQAVQVIIRGLQFHLNRAGFPLALDGKLGPKTARALNRVSPPGGSYAAKPWFQLYADVMRAAKGGGAARVTGSRVMSVSAAPMGMGAFDPTCDPADAACFAYLAKAQADFAEANATVNPLTLQHEEGAAASPDGTHWYTPPGGGGTTAGGTTSAEHWYDPRTWTSSLRKTGIPPVALAAGVAAGLYLLFRKKGRR